MVNTVPEDHRDPASDHLLTPKNSVIALIDYQPEQLDSVNSASTDFILLHAGAVADLAKAYDVPIVISTVGQSLGKKPTVDALRDRLPGVEEIDRNGVNAWQSPAFRQSIEATGRKKVVVAGLWTEVCVAFPTLDMIGEGYEVYPVVDAIAGLTEASHQAGLERMIQAGAHPISAMSLGSEYMRDWSSQAGDVFRPILESYSKGLQKFLNQ